MSAGTTFKTFVDEAYGTYAGLVMGGTKELRESAGTILRDTLPVSSPDYITNNPGTRVTDRKDSYLRESYSTVALHPPPKDAGVRYQSGDADADITLGTCLVHGGPLGGVIGETITREDPDESIAAIQRVASRTTTSSSESKIRNLLWSRGLSRYTGCVMSPSAMMAVVTDGSPAEKAIRIAEIHPGYGELLLSAAVTALGTDTPVVYHGLETNRDSMEERYDPQAGSAVPRNDIRGVLDVVSPPSDPDAIILTNDPDELGGYTYDVVVIRQPRDADEVTLAASHVSPTGKLIVIPGESPVSRGGVTAPMLTRLSETMGEPEMIGIQTLTQEYVGALVYRPAGGGVPEKPPVESPMPTKVGIDTIGGVPFLNAGKSRVPAVVLIARAAADTGAGCLVVEAPTRVIRTEIARVATRETGVMVCTVPSREESRLVSEWFRQRGTKVITGDQLTESGALTNMIRVETNTVKSRQRRHKGKYSRPTSVVLYGSCPGMIDAVSSAFPDASVCVVLPHSEVITHRTLDGLMKRGYGKVKIHKMVPGETASSAIASSVKASGASIVWNCSWGSQPRRRSPRPTAVATEPAATAAAAVATAAASGEDGVLTGGSRHVTLRQLLSPTTAVRTPYNVISTSLFKMRGDKQYKGFHKYTNGIKETIKNIQEYLSEHNFVFRLYVDDSITSDPKLFDGIMTTCRSAGFVEVIEYNAPEFRSPSGIGHLSTFGTLVRMMPVFTFGGYENIDIVCIRDLDIHYTPGQTYDDFFRFLRDESIQVLAYTNGYNPHHLRNVPRNQHDAVFGTGSVAFRPKLDAGLFDGFLDQLLDTTSPLHSDIIQPTIRESRRGDSAEGAVYYGVDELLLNHVMLPQIPEGGLHKAMFYDEPYYLVKRIRERYLTDSDASVDTDIRKKTPGETTDVIKRLLETPEVREKMPPHEYDHNKHYDITRTYERVML